MAHQIAIACAKRRQKFPHLAIHYLNYILTLDINLAFVQNEKYCMIQKGAMLVHVYNRIEPYSFLTCIIVWEYYKPNHLHL